MAHSNPPARIEEGRVNPVQVEVFNTLVRIKAAFAAFGVLHVFWYASVAQANRPETP